MAYIGNTLRTAQPNYQIIDDISASFNGSTTSFALQVGGVTPAPFPVSAQHCLISVGGVIQQPDPTGTDGFLLSGSNIVFSAAPSAGENFFGVVLAGADYINVGAEFPDGSVANPSITFDSDRDTGLYRKGANNIAIATNGTERVSVDNVETVFTQPTGDAKVRIHAAENDSGSDAELIVETSNDFAESALIFNDSSGVGGSIRYNHGDNATRFLTNGTTEQMRINASGHITTPNGPAFLVNRQSLFTSGPDTRVPYDSVRFNRGNHFDASAGQHRFNVPVSGVYYFFASCYRNPADTGAGFGSIRIFVNNVSYFSFTEFRPYVDNAHHYTMATLNLSAGDYVSVNASAFRVDSNSFFGGYLIG